MTYFFIVVIAIFITIVFYEIFIIVNNILKFLTKVERCMDKYLEEK